MAVIRPHDLLWGLTPTHLPADAPAWVAAALADGQPVVVRRDAAAPGQVAVGVRGGQREQRYATHMPVAAISRQLSPEALRHCVGQRDWPALRVLYRLRPRLDESGWAWGVGGSAGFELASGFTALHAGSDLDLIVRTPQPLAREQARELLALLEEKVDVQLQTPAGGVALREWAGHGAKVLLKAADGARLVSDPWSLAP
ncbi:malonate decarboxylase holo-ACP synthase [Pseudomonas eucalypticola]|uniref:Phosphoribosyl-dephospho-CoA transferase n=1 Tax=Pseudomonas eucalypticola TaxID=2599595 RepID=A0A7D5H908_9PSED|nr:malonate decarboxylase holo-ACP synthase [Pseudomonas eucalypticola]QKZ07229.1 malonate decarboxylase holo-ACP synthase [Pseudomonas eucalypticola]